MASFYHLAGICQGELFLALALPGMVTNDYLEFIFIIISPVNKFNNLSYPLI